MPHLPWYRHLGAEHDRTHLAAHGEWADADHQHTPRRLTDGSKAVKWQWPYSGFGEIAPQSTPAAGQAPLNYSLRYPGQVDDSNGLFYNWHRFYDPRVGRYTSSDPIGLEGGWNRFGYVDANPLGFTDPRGLQANRPKWWNDMWKPMTPPGNCANGECAAGLLPAACENRSVEQIDLDLNKRICETLCGLGLPIPGTSLPKVPSDIPKKAAEYFGKDLASSGVCSVICRP